MIEGSRYPAGSTIRLWGPLASCTALVAAMLSACTVGPDFRAPDAPQVARYTAEPMPEHTVDSPGPGGASQHFTVAGDIPAAWWTLFRCEPLDMLIRSALTESPNIAAAQAALREARENYRAQFGNSLLPSVSAQLGVQREKINGISFGQPNFNEDLNLYNSSVNVSYNLDLFGASRRTLEASQATTDQQNYQLRAAYLTLTSNIVTAAIREASLRAQIAAIEQIASDQQSQLELQRKQFAIGGIARSAVLSQQTQVAQTRARLPPLLQQLDQIRHQLAALAGRLPADGQIPEFRLDMFTLPDTLPVSTRAPAARHSRVRSTPAPGARAGRRCDRCVVSAVFAHHGLWIARRDACRYVHRGRHRVEPRCRAYPASF